MSALLFAMGKDARPRFHLSVCATYRTILPWMAQETQYCSLRYILGTVYSGNTEASEISPGRSQLCFSLGGAFRRSERMAADSTCERISDMFGEILSLPYHVADGESLYRLVLGCASRAVGASDRLNVTTPLLVTSAVQCISSCSNPRICHLKICMSVEK